MYYCIYSLGEGSEFGPMRIDRKVPGLEPNKPNKLSDDVPGL